MEENFKSLAQKLVKKRKVLLVKNIERNIKRKEQMTNLREELEENSNLGLEENMSLNKEALEILLDGFKKDLRESFILIESVYGANENFEYN